MQLTANGAVGGRDRRVGLGYSGMASCPPGWHPVRPDGNLRSLPAGIVSVLMQPAKGAIPSRAKVRLGRRDMYPEHVPIYPGEMVQS